MSTCRRCGRERPLLTGADLPLLAFLAALFVLLAYQAGFEAGAAAAAAALDTYAP